MQTTPFEVNVLISVNYFPFFFTFSAFRVWEILWRHVRILWLALPTSWCHSYSQDQLKQPQTGLTIRGVPYLASPGLPRKAGSVLGPLYHPFENTAPETARCVQRHERRKIEFQKIQNVVSLQKRNIGSIEKTVCRCINKKGMPRHEACHQTYFGIVLGLQEFARVLTSIKRAYSTTSSVFTHFRVKNKD